MRMNKKEKLALTKIAVLCELLVDAIEEKQMITKKRLKQTPASAKLHQGCKMVMEVAADVTDMVFKDPVIKTTTFFNTAVIEVEKIVNVPEYNFMDRKNKIDTFLRRFSG